VGVGVGRGRTKGNGREREGSSREHQGTAEKRMGTNGAGVMGYQATHQSYLLDMAIKRYATEEGATRVQIGDQVN